MALRSLSFSLVSVLFRSALRDKLSKAKKKSARPAASSASQSWWWRFAFASKPLWSHHAASWLILYFSFAWHFNFDKPPRLRPARCVSKLRLKWVCRALYKMSAFVTRFQNDFHLLKMMIIMTEAKFYANSISSSTSKKTHWVSCEQYCLIKSRHCWLTSMQVKRVQVLYIAQSSTRNNNEALSCSRVTDLQPLYKGRKSKATKNAAWSSDKRRTASTSELPKAFFKTVETDSFSHQSKPFYFHLPTLMDPRLWIQGSRLLPKESLKPLAEAKKKLAERGLKCYTTNDIYSI